MSDVNYTIVVDAGNTRIKIGVFQKYDLQEVRSFDNEQLNLLKAFLIPYEKNHGIICSVRSQKDTKWLQGLLPQAKLFTHQTKTPLVNHYEMQWPEHITPTTKLW